MPRMVIEVFFKVNLSLMEQLVAIRQVRRACTLPQVLFASRTLYADADAKIVECNSSAAVHRIWPLCSQGFFLLETKALIMTEADESSWRLMVDKLLEEDS